jgi:hypothetical protein
MEETGNYALVRKFYEQKLHPRLENKRKKFSYRVVVIVGIFMVRKQSF